jgi:hypothetical protein
MIVAATPANPRPADYLDGLVEFRVDPQAERGDVVGALAALLVGIDRRRRERAAADEAEADDVPMINFQALIH